MQFAERFAFLFASSSALLIINCLLVFCRLTFEPGIFSNERGANIGRSSTAYSTSTGHAYSRHANILAVISSSWPVLLLLFLFPICQSKWFRLIPPPPLTCERRHQQATRLERNSNSNRWADDRLQNGSWLIHHQDQQWNLHTVRVFKY